MSARVVLVDPHQRRRAVLAEALAGAGLFVDDVASMKDAEVVLERPDLSALVLDESEIGGASTSTSAWASNPKFAVIVLGTDTTAMTADLTVPRSSDMGIVVGSIRACLESWARRPVQLPLRSAKVDLLTGHVTRADGGLERLTSKERELLVYLWRREGKTVPREELLRRVWGYRMASRTVDTAVNRLRNKIERDPHAPDHLFTDRGAGYRFDSRWEIEAAVTPDRPSGLAPEPDAFVGRDVWLTKLQTLVTSRPLVTVMGPPGVGKSRLVWHWLASQASAWPGGIHLASMADAATPDLAWERVARSFQMDAPTLSKDPKARWTTLPPFVLWLDDLHPALPRDLVVGWLEQLGTGNRLIVTSREALQIPGEARLDLPPLEPAEAVRLFEERASTPPEPEDPTVPRLVGRLDHLPLAIELASALTSTLTPHEIEAQLDARRLDLGSRAGVPERSATLRGAYEASWEALSPELKETLEALTAFEGTFDVEAATAVLGGASVGPLTELRSRSLLLRRHEGGSSSFELLHTIAAFVRERLTALDQATYAERHFRHYLHRLERAGDNLALAPDLHNLRVAEAWVVTHGDPALLARWLIAKDPVALAHGPLPHHFALLRSVLDRASDLLPRLVGELAIRTASTARYLGRIAEMEAALTHVPDERPYTQRAKVLRLIVRAMARNVDDDATELLEELTDPAESEWMVSARVSVATQLRYVHRPGDAIAILVEGIALLRAWNQPHRMPPLQIQHASMLINERRYDEAQRMLESLLDQPGVVDNQRQMGLTHLRIGETHLARGQLQEAREHTQLAKTIARAGGFRLEVLATANLATIALSEDDLRAAEAYLGEAESLIHLWPIPQIAVSLPLLRAVLHHRQGQRSLVPTFLAKATSLVAVDDERSRIRLVEQRLLPETTGAGEPVLEDPHWARIFGPPGPQ